jgi:hypothetical protein
MSLALFLLLAAGSRLAGQPVPAPAPAQAEATPGLMVAPVRLVFTNRQHSAMVSLTNTGNTPGTYHVSLQRVDMDDNGTITILPLERAPGQVAFQDMIRFAPKEVTLEPRETQAVRIDVRRPADLPVGEYRLELVFQEDPPSASAPDPVTGAETDKRLTVGLIASFGVAMPGIFRNGKTSAQTNVTGLALDASRKHLLFRLERTGNQSVFGDIQAILRPRSGKPQVLAESKGLAVYTPNAFRNFSLPLDPLPPQGGGTIQVTYSVPPEEGGGLLAEGSLDLR